MATLEDLKPGIKVTGIVPGQPATIVDVKWQGATALIVHPDHLLTPPIVVFQYAFPLLGGVGGVI